MTTYSIGSTKIKVKPDGTLRFLFVARPNDEREFEFSMLCEVGEPWQASFKELMTEHGLVLGEQRELDISPWLADTLAAAK